MRHFSFVFDWKRRIAEINEMKYQHRNNAIIELIALGIEMFAYSHFGQISIKFLLQIAADISTLKVV